MVYNEPKALQLLTTADDIERSVASKHAAVSTSIVLFGKVILVSVVSI